MPSSSVIRPFHNYCDGRSSRGRGAQDSKTFPFSESVSSRFQSRIECYKAGNRMPMREDSPANSVFQNDHYFPSSTNGLRVNAYQIFRRLSRSLGPV